MELLQKMKDMGGDCFFCNFVREKGENKKTRAKKKHLFDLRS